MFTHTILVLFIAISDVIVPKFNRNQKQYKKRYIGYIGIEDILVYNNSRPNKHPKHDLFGFASPSIIIIGERGIRISTKLKT